jgi:Poly(ADP-ribose) polymerase catalytic domain.
MFGETVYHLHQPRDFTINEVNNLILFHGTSREAVEPIINDGFTPSRNNELYLGHGVYFHDCEELVIRWRWDKTKPPQIVEDAVQKKLKGYLLNVNDLNDLITSFNREQGVIVSRIKSATYLDMDNVNNKKIFKKIYKAFYKNTKEIHISDTSIYQVLFEEFGLKDIYDMVTLTFKVYNTKKGSVLPQHNILHKEYCIKSENFIIDRCECKITEENMIDFLKIIVTKKEIEGV